ncbi:MAG: NifB/NifX family molybdenum-iron cluster-binding protein [Deltaproteobacteria bacterium]|nr:NifB/NifX family molybdenum-iron cluster-binding protein [Deltaproteobacteria bacterium]
MKIAIPTAGGLLAMHFGHCESFTLIDVDETTKTIGKVTAVVPPPHQPGLLPPWVKEQGATHVIAGGMGARAQELFAAQGIKVLVGATAENPEKIVSDFLTGKLIVGLNACDH